MAQNEFKLKNDISESNNSSTEADSRPTTPQYQPNSINEDDYSKKLHRLKIKKDLIKNKSKIDIFMKKCNAVVVNNCKKYEVEPARIRKPFKL